MDFARYFTLLLSELFLIPAGILCIIPMENQLRYPRKKVLLRVLSCVIILLPLGALIQYHFDIAPNLVIFPIVLISFIVYRTSINSNLAQLTAIVLFVSNFMVISSNLARAIDSGFHPEGGANQITLEFSLFRLGFSLIFLLSYFYAMRKYLGFLVDRMADPKVWLIRSLISGLLFIINVSMEPLKYETLYVNNIMRVFLSLQFLIMILELLIGIIFYYILNGLISLSELRAQTNLMEMQEKAYEKQQRYMEDNARIRHDFKHTIRSIKMMADNEEYDDLKKFLDEYVKTIPENEIRIYCKNSALNALLNHYRIQAQGENIDIRYNIELPSAERMGLSNTELCNMIGNILENAINAGKEMTEGDRYIRLTLRVERNKDFYIVAVNSFNGNALQKNGQYLSTGKKRSGVGLRSITSTVEQHGGIVNFHHEGTEFYSDIMIPLVKEEAN